MKRILVAALLAVSPFALANSAFDKPGFVTKLEKGRLWVFEAGSKELEQFEKVGEPTIAVSKIGEGPEGITLRGPSLQVLEAYQAK